MQNATLEKPAISLKKLAADICKQLKPKTKAQALKGLGYLLGKDQSPKGPEYADKCITWLDKLLSKGNIHLDEDEREELEEELYAFLKKEHDDIKAENDRNKNISSIQDEVDRKIAQILNRDKISLKDNAKLIVLQLRKKSPEVQRLVRVLLLEAYNHQDPTEALKNAAPGDLEAAQKIVERLTLLRNGSVGRLVTEALNPELSVSSMERMVSLEEPTDPTSSAIQEAGAKLGKDIFSASSAEIPIDQQLRQANIDLQQQTKKLLQQLKTCNTGLRHFVDNPSFSANEQALNSLLKEASKALSELGSILEKTRVKASKKSLVVDLIDSLWANSQLISPQSHQARQTVQVIQQDAASIIGTLLNEKELQAYQEQEYAEPETAPSKPTPPLPQQSAPPPHPGPLNFPEVKAPAPPISGEALRERALNLKKEVLGKLFDSDLPTAEKIGIEITYPNGNIDRVVGFHPTRKSPIIRRTKPDGSIQIGTINKDRIRKQLDTVILARREPVSYAYHHPLKENESVTCSQLGIGDVIACTTARGYRYELQVMKITHTGKPMIKLVGAGASSTLERRMSNPSQSFFLDNITLQKGDGLMVSSFGKLFSILQTDPITKLEILMAPSQFFKKKKNEERPALHKTQVLRRKSAA